MGARAQCLGEKEAGTHIDSPLTVGLEPWSGLPGNVDPGGLGKGGGMAARGQSRAAANSGKGRRMVTLGPEPEHGNNFTKQKSALQ